MKTTAYNDPDGMIAMSKASALGLTVPGLMFWLLATGCDPADAASPAPAMTQFDGNYKGTFTLSGAPVRGGYSRSIACVDEKIEQLMSVSGGQIYLDRKSSFSNAPLLLSGTVSADGSVSAAGITPDDTNPGSSLFFTLTGKIENNQFTGKLDNRSCYYRVEMKR
jgi:hypothetical protein